MKDALLIAFGVGMPLVFAVWIGFEIYGLMRYGGREALQLANRRSEPLGLKDEY